MKNAVTLWFIRNMYLAIQVTKLDFSRIWFSGTGSWLKLLEISCEVDVVMEVSSAMFMGGLFWKVLK